MLWFARKLKKQSRRYPHRRTNAFQCPVLTPMTLWLIACYSTPQHKHAVSTCSSRCERVPLSYSLKFRDATQWCCSAQWHCLNCLLITTCETECSGLRKPHIFSNSNWCHNNFLKMIQLSSKGTVRYIHVHHNSISGLMSLNMPHSLTRFLPQPTPFLLNS